MKLTLLILATLLFVATVVRAEEEEPTDIEKVKDQLPQDKEDEVTAILDRDDESPLQEMTQEEEQMPGGVNEAV